MSLGEQGTRPSRQLWTCLDQPRSSWSDRRRPRRSRAQSYLVRWLDGRLSVLSPAAIQLAPKGPAALVHVIGSDRSRQTSISSENGVNRGSPLSSFPPRRRCICWDPATLRSRDSMCCPPSTAWSPALLSLLWLGARWSARSQPRCGTDYPFTARLSVPPAVWTPPAFRTRTRRAFAPVEAHRNSSRRSS